jgi:hypothetical protein
MLEASQIKARCAAIRLQGKELAGASRCSMTTVYSLFRGDGGRTDTLSRLTAALEAEELRLRDHLLALHPLEREPVREAAE